MKHKRIVILIIVCLFAIGFANVSTYLYSSGTLAVEQHFSGTVTFDYDTTDQENVASITGKGTQTLTFNANKFNNLGDSATVKYRVHNGASYKVTIYAIVCSTTSDYSYISIKQSNTINGSSIDANGYSAYDTVTIKQTGTSIEDGELQIPITCTLYTALDGTDTTTAKENIFNQDFNYTGAVQTYTVKQDGTYKLEVWGAQGGKGANSSSGTDSISNAVGGKGGYSVGTINLKYNDILYVYVGGAGGGITSSSSDYNGGFNGGGQGGLSNQNGSRAGGGGGASDFRINTDSLYARVIVAGGGGSASWGYSGESGGAGGGESSIASTNNSPDVATQTSGYAFGQGQNSYTSSIYYDINGAGGGGWYGGYSSQYGVSGTTYRSHGTGGSGYVYTLSTAANYPSGCLLNSYYYLTDAKTIAGNTSFTSPTGSSETGHSGNGYARITYIG